MSDLRHRLQEAVFATAFRRRIQQHAATSSMPSKDSKTMSSKEVEQGERGEISAIDKLLEDYIKPQRLSFALETFTTTQKPVQLITADIVEGSGHSGSAETFQNLKSTTESSKITGRMFDDAFKEPLSSNASTQFPRVPAWIAVTVCTACVLTFFLNKRQADFGLNQRRMMPDPLTVQGLCHTTPSCHIGPISAANSRRNSFIMDQDRAASSIWANP
ncbi:unnamed protein product [Caenorhabditis sp. 36 PRJEB53466]|nr:unnamed protein product [Caenorhabditis sp. 36 PRJEB53466]